MRLRINGVLQADPQEHQPVGQWLIDWFTQKTQENQPVGPFLMDKATEKVTDLIGSKIWDSIVYINDQIVAILPELTVFIVIILVSIGMWTNFGKWLGRALVVFLGGAVWLYIHSAV